MNLGDGFWIEIGTLGRHFYVVAAFDGEWTIAFNATRHPPKYDLSCPVDATDDDRLTQQSWMVFAPCDPMVTVALDREVQRGTLHVKPVSPEFLLKVQQGALRSPQTERKYKRLLEAMGITLPATPPEKP